MNDPVNHPSHYTQGGIECIDAIEASMTKEEFIGFLRGQVIKYTWRMNHKGCPLEDLKKMLWYGEKLKDFLSDVGDEKKSSEIPPPTIDRCMINGCMGTKITPPSLPPICSVCNNPWGL